MSFLYRCTNRGCKWLRDQRSRGRPYETTLTTKGTYPNCAHCSSPMKGPLTPGSVVTGPFDYDAAVAKVNAKLDSLGASKNTKDYCQAVMDSLLDYAAPLKATFVADMKKDPDVAVFVNANRANDVQKRCVDDALAMAGATKSPGHPVGEKYDWEQPYIMNVARWPIASGIGVAWVDMGAFLGNCANGTQYLVMTRLKGRADGHTILITKIDGDLWISDKQQQNYNYDKCDCIAWSRPGNVTSSAVSKPKRKVATDGKFDGDWVTR